MVDWIYNNPTWYWGSVFVGGLTVLTCLGLLVVHRLVDVETRHAHNDAAQAFISVVGTCYAVLIAFIAVVAWQSFTDADKAASTEANLIGNLYEDTLGLPDASGKAIRDNIKLYLDQVIKDEWPAQQQGRISRADATTLLHVHEEIVDLKPTAAGEAVIQAELLRTMNELYSARRSRQLAAQGAIPPIVWWIIGLGTAMIIAFTYLIGVRNLLMHAAMTGMVAVSLALVITLIVALDRPFRGDLSVDTDAYENVRDGLDTWMAVATQRQQQSSVPTAPRP